MSRLYRFCPDCQEERLFEQYHHAPGECPDSPDGQCPEWSCTDCGAALLTGPVSWLDGGRPRHHLPGKVA